jgi:hypothetical protein
MFRQLHAVSESFHAEGSHVLHQLLELVTAEITISIRIMVFKALL